MKAESVLAALLIEQTRQKRETTFVVTTSTERITIVIPDGLYQLDRFEFGSLIAGGDLRKTVTATVSIVKVKE